jgi:hypothetical protein
MSIATLKKKTAAKYNNMSVNVPQFSINGGHRSQGWVGQTTLSRSLPKTPMVGDTPRGSGGCCGTYNIATIVQSAVTSTNNPEVIKPSVLSNDGMLATKYRWIGRPAPYTSVKPGAGNNLNDQSDYITRKAKESINATTNNCPPIPKDPCNESCSNIIFKGRRDTPHGVITNSITKKVGPKSGGEYISELSDECVNNDVQFQEKNNTGNGGTPFACGQ